MRGTSISKTETSASQGGVSANVSIGVNTDGTYSVSVGVPQIKGRTTGSQSSTYSGQCVPKEGKNLTSPSTETSVEGNSLTSDGTHRVDPANPNQISGSFTRSWQNVTETITWNLQKCGAPLRLTDLRFEEMKFPNWNDWAEFTEQKGTTDGNLVRIKATVLNASGETKYADLKFKETFKGDKWNGARPDGILNGGEVSVRVDAGEEKEVELIWDSSGYSWFDDGRPRLLQRIKAELEENGKKIDQMTKNVKVAPKPVVLVHGLWSSWKAWEPWQNILTTSHSYDWKAYPVGEKPDKGVMNTGGSFLSTQPTNSIAENARQLESYIKYAQEDRNAWHVDIVAHSMGGLISRYYIAQILEANSPNGRPKVSHLVMLGTPNMGSPCADVMNVAFEATGNNVEAIRQLRQDYLEGFNRINVNRKGVKFSVLAGNPLPTMCKALVWNDGVVPVPSAKWKIKDNAESKSLHTDLTGTKDFSDFVKPRLAIGPKGDHNAAPPELRDYPNQIGEASTEALTDGAAGTGQFLKAVASRVYGMRPSWAAALEEAAFGVGETAPFAKELKVAPKQRIELEVPVDAAANFGVTFMADPSISATLVDENGKAVAQNLARSPEASGWFRSLFHDKPTTPGTWKIILENTGDLEYPIFLTTWKDAK